MSMNNTEEWASMVINELFDEANAFEKISSHHDNDLSRYASENYIDNDLKSNNQELEELSLISNASSDDFNKANSVLTSINDQEIFTNEQNLTADCNMKTNFQLLQVTDIKIIATNTTDRTTDEKIKNGHISTCGFITESTKGEVLLNDHDTAFIQENENESLIADESPKFQKLSFSAENIKESSKYVSGNSDEIPEIVPSFSFEESRYMYEQKRNKFLLRIADGPHEKFFKNFYLHNDSADFSEQFGEFGIKNDFKTERINSASADLDTISASSQDYFNGVDEKIGRIGFNNFQTYKNGEVDRVSKRIDSNLGFVENYMEEEMCGPTDEIIESEYLAASNFKAFGKDLMGNVNNATTRDKARRNWCLKDEADENVFYRQKNTYDMCSKRRNNMFLEQSLKNVNETVIGRKHEHLDDAISETISGITRYSDEFGEHRISRNNGSRYVKGHPKKSIFTECNSSIKEQEEEETAGDAEKVDNEELEILGERARRVVSSYRDICSRFETIFVMPFANVLADSYDFLMFIFSLAFCLLCFLYERMHILISNYRSLNVEKSLNSSCDEKENSLLVSEKSMTTTLVTDTALTDESLLFRSEKKTIANVPVLKNEVIKQLIDVNSWVKIEPTEIAVTSMNHGIISDNVTYLHEKGENFLTLFCSRQQNRAIAKINDKCVVHLRFISNNQNEESEMLLPEIDLDKEIVASSKRLPCDTDKITTQESADNLFHVEEIPDQYENDAEPVIKKNSISFSTEILPRNGCGDERPLFNSTEVDEFDMESTSKYRSCPDFEILSATNLDSIDECSKIEKIPRNFVERNFNSSLDVNLSSLSSRSDILSESMALLNESKDADNHESKLSAENLAMFPEIQKENCEALFSNTLEASAVEDSVKEITNETEKVLSGKKDENVIESYCDKNSRIPSKKPHMRKHVSGTFYISDANDTNFEDNNHLERSLMCGDANFITGLSKPTDEYALSMKDEAVPNEIKDNPKEKINLRRRMSLIFSNWKRRQGVPSCMGKNTQSKKKI